jgi:tetratricopeptide (TPR) repeat protein
VHAQTQLPDTDDLEVQLRLADARFKAGQTEAALQQIHNLARLLDQNGRSAEALELYSKVLDQLQRAVRADPRNEDRYLDLAGFLESQHATDALITVLATGAKALPQSIKIRSALGAAYILTGQTDLAEETLQKVLEDQPAYEVGYKLLGECYERAQNWSKLRSIALQLKAINAKNAYGWYYEASAGYHLLAASRDTSLNAVRQSVQQAVALDPTVWRSQVLLGRVLLDAGEAEKAVAAFQEAARLNPEVASTHYLLSTALKKAGRVDESRRALDDFREAQARQKAQQSRRVTIGVR